MRIGIFTDTFQDGLGGLTTYVRQEAANLEAQGHAVRVFAWHADQLTADDRHLCATWPAAPLVPSAHLRLGFAPRSVLRAVGAFGPEVLHSHSQFGMGWHAVYVARRLDRPLVSHCHYVLETGLHFLPPLWRRLAPVTRRLLRGHARAIYQRADLVLAPSEALRSYLAGIGVTRPIRVIPIGVPLGPGSARPSDDGGPFTVLCVGRVSAEKNLDFALEVFADFAAKRPARLEIVGDGPERPRLVDHVSRLGLGSRVCFRGWVHHVDLAATYAAGDVLLHACETETFGLAVLEAFRHGLPVIAPAAMALPELVHDGENGLLFRPHDRAQAVAALMALFDDPARRRALAAGATSTAGRYEESAMFARLVESLHEACVGARL